MAGKMLVSISNVDMRHENGTKYYQVCSIANQDANMFMLVTMWGSLKNDAIASRHSKTYFFSSTNNLLDAAQVKVFQKGKKGYISTSTLGQNWLGEVLDKKGCPIRGMTTLPLSVDAVLAKSEPFSDWQKERAVRAIENHLGKELYREVVNHFREAEGGEIIVVVDEAHAEVLRAEVETRKVAYGDTWGAW